MLKVTAGRVADGVCSISRLTVWTDKRIESESINTNSRSQIYSQKTNDPEEK